VEGVSEEIVANAALANPRFEVRGGYQGPLMGMKLVILCQPLPFNVLLPFSVDLGLRA
jgi:hypothetical protein